MRAQKIQKRTASVGFDWNTTEEIFKKIDEGKIELQEAISADDTDSISEGSYVDADSLDSLWRQVKKKN